MICEECKKKKSEFTFVEVVNGEKKKRHLCSDCAEKLAMAIPKIVGGVTPPLRKLKEEEKVKCPQCGMNYLEFEKRARFGCPQCYEVFKDQILPLLNELHGSTKYMGRRYSLDSRKASLIKKRIELEKKLKEAVKKEAFEEAARIRDKLRKLEEELK